MMIAEVSVWHMRKNTTNERKGMEGRDQINDASVIFIPWPLEGEIRNTRDIVMIWTMTLPI